MLRRHRKRALVVLFTALEPGALGEGLLPVLPRLAARHRVIVAAVHDPALDRAGRRRAGTGRGATPPRPAERALAERRPGPRGPRPLRRDVVDAPAGPFAPAVADTYLDLKAAGQL